MSDGALIAAMDPENSLLMRAHMNQYVAEEISDTSIHHGTVPPSPSPSPTFVFPLPAAAGEVSSATYCFNNNNEFCGSIAAVPRRLFPFLAVATEMREVSHILMALSRGVA